MKKTIKTFSRKIAGKEITIEIDRFNTLADGCLTVQMGDSVVIANATMGRKADLERDYFPLSVDYEENFYAAGKIKGSRFVKRRGRPNDDTILISRLIDRGLRPTFPKGMRNPVQIVASALSFDKENGTDILAAIGASAALSISGIPSGGPVGTVRVGLIDDQFVVNPTVSERKSSVLDLVISTIEDRIIMIEAGAQEISEEIMTKAIELGRKTGMEIISFIKEVVDILKADSKITVLEATTTPEYSEELAIKLLSEHEDAITKVFSENSTKNAVQDAVNELMEEELEKLFPEETENTEKERTEFKKAFDGMIKKVIRKNVLDKDLRIGGRKMDEIRNLEAEAGVLPRTHGSGYFQRGETRALTITTLGAPSEGMIVDGMEEERTKGYMHFYSFPPYSTGETSPLRSPGRREIGHGALAEKALFPMIPSKKEFPYTILLQTEILSCNGSSSMGSVCGSTLALMDAGVPIKRPIAGIAMGLITNPENREKFKVLTDIRGLEDFGGDMDFKVAGSEEGITAIQMDTKLDGLPNASITETLEKARLARLQILEVIKSAISESRAELSQYAPRIITIKINPEKIGELIGPGGKTINGIIDATGAKVDIEDDGSVFISSTESAEAEAALKMVKAYTREVKAGEIFEGKVAKIMDFGAFVEITPKQSGLVHISEISEKRIDRVEDVLKIGDIVKVKVKEIDKMGRTNLTMRNINK